MHRIFTTLNYECYDREKERKEQKFKYKESFCLH